MRLFRRREPARPVERAATVRSAAPAASATPVEMTGTTTHGAGNLARLFAAHDQADGGLLEMLGQLVPEPDNPADPNAVAVHVEGERIGYLPGYLAEHAPHSDQVDGCRVQLWGATTGSSLRVRGWVAWGRTAVAWPHTAANPPAITVDERRIERAADTTRMVDEALADGGPRATHFRRGMLGNYHYLETVEPIKQLKRDGRLEEALALCYGAIEAAEKDRDGREAAPWYTEQAAIIHRKLGEQADEEAVLRRWLKHCPPERRASSRIQERLDKLTAS